MRQEYINKIISNQSLVEELLALNKLIIETTTKSLPSSMTKDGLATAWFHWSKIKDRDLKDVLINHTRFILSDFNDYKELIDLWYATTSIDLRTLISQHLASLVAKGLPMTKNQIIKLAQIFKSE